IDFYDLGLVVKPVLDKFDHSFMVWIKDKPLAEYLKKHKMKHVAVDYYATVENISRDFLNRISAGLKKQKIKNISAITVKISETPNSYAEARIEV
ncbi:MAG: 6-carboxytetrahydropterin synthase, partial [Ignavibacteriae bacterium]|nr:6-carboxytetrahydropterin synthase [Ignavibacteriota bacterium]